MMHYNTFRLVLSYPLEHLDKKLINYTNNSIYTRHTEWKNFPSHGLNKKLTIVTKEEPCDFRSNNYEEYLNWFSFIKNSNEFYFAGETREKCYIAAGKIAETYFKISREKFDKL